ncbi:IclR family transcriptional regulator [Nonomuraea aridisoli]|uniref:IclR family transcriptional regulator n=1 Tax=Nonomuraea aridisoli TaxID=2070368 RepID=A0A2W2EID2_9ACTN|nr:IclR family transcriptional regulator C-terminal domain-containing protein [Nonomuraea aridisoli]PZG22083.1 IclR family transcriptional regulator [Nonomuraea aridisoli]
MTEPFTADDDGVLQTLVRGLDVLRTVADMDGQATARTLSQRLGLSLSRCYHILRTLKATGHITRLPGGKLGIGPGGAALGRRLHAGLEPPPELSAVLTRLHLRTRETAYVSGWVNGDITLLRFVSAERAPGIGGLDVGYTGDVHARASCRAVLAHLPPEQADAVLRGDRLRRLTPRTQCDPDLLHADLTAIRRRGHAVDLEEFRPGLCCASAPYFDRDGRPAGSYTVSAPAARFGRSQRDLVAAVQEAAAVATNLIAGRGPGRPAGVTPERRTRAG